MKKRTLQGVKAEDTDGTLGGQGACLPNGPGLAYVAIKGVVFLSGLYSQRGPEMIVAALASSQLDTYTFKSSYINVFC